MHCFVLWQPFFHTQGCSWGWLANSTHESQFELHRASSEGCWKSWIPRTSFSSSAVSRSLYLHRDAHECSSLSFTIAMFSPKSLSGLGVRQAWCTLFDISFTLFMFHYIHTLLYSGDWCHTYTSIKRWLMRCRFIVSLSKVACHIVLSSAVLVFVSLLLWQTHLWHRDRGDRKDQSILSLNKVRRLWWRESRRGEILGGKNEGERGISRLAKTLVQNFWIFKAIASPGPSPKVYKHWKQCVV